MSGTRAPDEVLRLRALEALGPLGNDLARDALETGVVAIEHDVLRWEGSHGPMHGHRVVVSIPSVDLHARVVASHSARDALAASLAAAMAERGGHAVADVTVVLGSREVSSSPYRDPRDAS